MANKRADLLTHDFKTSIDWHLAHKHRLIRLHKPDGSTCRNNPRLVGKAPLDKNWRDTSQRLTRKQVYEAVRLGYNIGWAPTPDYVILDIDMHGKDGLATYNKLCHLLPEDELIPKVVSSRGGFHLYFRKPADVEVSAAQLKRDYGQGVDVIVNTQVVIPASVHPVTQRPYEFANMPDDVPYWTPELRDLLKIQRTKTETKLDDRLPDINAVAHLVGALPNDDDTDYDTWFATGCAIHKSTGGSEEGYEIFSDWSSLNNLFDEDYTRRKWESMGNYGGQSRGFGSLVVEAREYDPQLVSNVLGQIPDVSAEEDFAELDLPPPDKDFDVNKRAWRLTEEKLDYADVAPDEFYYTDVLPRGAYSVMAGRQGLGKSSLIMHLAACITTGTPFPGDEDNPIKREPGDVLYFSVEERIRQSILPKLKQSGADLSKFHAYRAGVIRENKKGEQEVRGFSITTGIQQLEAALRQYPKTLLVIFDPITMFIVHQDTSASHNTASMNQALAPLNKLAEDYDLCVLGITHFNKSGGSGLDKVTGSIAHTTVARHVTYLLPHYVENHTILATAKSNMFTDKTSYVFEGIELDPEKIEGYDTPLRQRTLHLVERNTDRVDADEWERRVIEETANRRRRSSVEYLSGQILDHILANRNEQTYWPSVTFKDYFKARFNSHESTFEQTLKYMLDESLLHQENVAGTWFIWYIDSLIIEDEAERETYNEQMRERIRNEHPTPGNSQALRIYDFINDNFPLEVPHASLYDEFLDLSEKQIQRTLKILIEQGKIERIKKHRAYYLVAL